MNIFTNTDTINKPTQTQIDGLQIEIFERGRYYKDSIDNDAESR